MARSSALAYLVHFLELEVATFVYDSNSSAVMYIGLHALVLLNSGMSMFHCAVYRLSILRQYELKELD